MDSSTDHLKRRSHITINLEDPIHLLRPDDLAGGLQVRKAAKTADLLGFCKEGLAAPQLRLDALALGDITHSSSELGWTAVARDVLHDHMDVLDRPVRHEQAMFKIYVEPFAGRAFDCLLHQCEVLRVNTAQNQFD